MVTITEINQSFNLITTMGGTLLALYEFYSYQSTKNKITDFVKLNVESCNFLTDPLKEFYKKEQRRNLFYEYTGIDASDDQQILIKELRSKLDVKFSLYQLKMASKYFKYNDDTISIYIKPGYIWGARRLAIISIILATLSFLLICLSIFSQETTKLPVNAYFVIGIISIIYIAFFTHKFCAPVYLAQCVEKQLGIIENKR